MTSSYFKINEYNEINYTKIAIISNPDPVRRETVELFLLLFTAAECCTV